MAGPRPSPGSQEAASLAGEESSHCIPSFHLHTPELVSALSYWLERMPLSLVPVLEAGSPLGERGQGG